MTMSETPNTEAGPPDEAQMRREALDRANFGGGPAAEVVKRAEENLKFLKKSKTLTEYQARCDSLQRAQQAGTVDLAERAETYFDFLAGAASK